MYITYDNRLKNTSPNVATGASGDVPSNMTSSDFSLNYTFATSTAGVVFGARANISHFALSGINIANKEISIRDNAEVIASYTPSNNGVLVFLFERRDFVNLRLVIKGSGQPATIMHVSAGNTMKVPNGGETSGYARQWLTRGVKSRVAVNSLSQPIAALQKSETLKVTLSLPNMLTTWVESTWQGFLNRIAVGDCFYITEQDSVTSDKPQASYVCFEPDISAPTAHSQTRALQNLQLTCRAYNGI